MKLKIGLPKKKYFSLKAKMSKIYFIKAALGLEYSDSNIEKILKKGQELGFKYYEYLYSKNFENSISIGYKLAFEVLQIKLKNSDVDQSLLVEICKEQLVQLRFYKSEYNYLIFDITLFSHPKEKHLEEIGTFIDFKYYIDIALNLGDDFGIEKLVADHMD